MTTKRERWDTSPDNAKRRIRLDDKLAIRSVQRWREDDHIGCALVPTEIPNENRKSRCSNKLIEQSLVAFIAQSATKFREETCSLLQVGETTEVPAA